MYLTRKIIIIKITYRKIISWCFFFVFSFNSFNNSSPFLQPSHCLFYFHIVLYMYSLYFHSNMLIYALLLLMQSYFSLNFNPFHHTKWYWHIAYVSTQFATIFNAYNIISSSRSMLLPSNYSRLLSDVFVIVLVLIFFKNVHHYIYSFRCPYCASRTC